MAVAVTPTNGHKPTGQTCQMVAMAAPTHSLPTTLAVTPAHRSGGSTTLDKIYTARRQQTALTSSSRAMDTESSGVEGSSENIAGPVCEIADIGGSGRLKGSSKKAIAGQKSAGQRPTRLSENQTRNASGIPRAPSNSSRDLSPQSRTSSKESLAGKRIVQSAAAGVLSLSQQQQLLGQLTQGPISRVAGGKGDAAGFDSGGNESGGDYMTSGIPRPHSANDKPLSVQSSHGPGLKAAYDGLIQTSAAADGSAKAIPKALTAKKQRQGADTSRDTVVPGNHQPSHVVTLPASSCCATQCGVVKPYNQLPGLQMYLKSDSPSAVASAAGQDCQRRRYIATPPHVVSGPLPVMGRGFGSSESPRPQIGPPVSSGSTSDLKNNVLTEASRKMLGHGKSTHAVSPSLHQHKSDCVTQTEPTALQKIAAQVQKTTGNDSSAVGERNVLRKEAGNQTARELAADSHQVTTECHQVPAAVSHSQCAKSSTACLLPPKVSTARVATIASLQAKDRLVAPYGVVITDAGSDVGSSGNGSHNKLSSASSSNDSIIYRSSTDAASVSPLVQIGTRPVKGSRKVETTFNVKGGTETKIASDQSMETTFEAAAVGLAADSASTLRPMQPLNQLASYEFLQRLGASRTSISGSSRSSTGAVLPSTYSTPSFNRFGLMHRSFMTKSSVRSLHDDCTSDVETYATGYTSDVAGSSRGSHYEDFSGYLSEGGASMYAHKMQQRFREGMMAVKECMTKSTHFLDDADDDDGGDESFDDDSSVSSGDISDAPAAVTSRDADSRCSEDSSSSSVQKQLRLAEAAANNEAVSRGDVGGQRNNVKCLSSYISNSGSLQKNTNALMGMQQDSGTECIGAGSEGAVPQPPAVTPVSGWRGSSGYASDSGCTYYGAPAAASAEGVTTAPAVITPLAKQRLLEQQRAKGLISSKTQQSLASSRNHEELYKSSTLGRSGSCSSSAARNGGGSLPFETSPANCNTGETTAGHNPSLSGMATPRSRQLSLTCPSNYASLEYGPSAADSAGVWLKGYDHLSLTLAAGAAHCPRGIGQSWHQGALPAGRSGCHPTAAMLAPTSARMGCAAAASTMLTQTASSIHTQIQQARALSAGAVSTVSIGMPCSSGLRHNMAANGMPRPCMTSAGAATQQQCVRSGICWSSVCSSGNAAVDWAASRVPAAGGEGARPCAHLHQQQPDGSAMPSARSSICSACTSASEEDTNYRSSSQSLVSSSSSMYSTAEEKQAAEVRKLKQELERAKEKVMTLTSQLSSNAHVVQAFEQSLTNMTLRLQHLSSTSEQKDSELTDLKVTIEHLHKMSGLAQADIQNAADKRFSSGQSNGVGLTRQMSADSINSLNSINSGCSSASHQQLGGTSGANSSMDAEGKGKKKKKNWLRSSFTKAFSRKKSSGGSASDVEGDVITATPPTASSSGSHLSDLSFMSAASAPTSPMHHPPVMTVMRAPLSPIACGPLGEEAPDSSIGELKKQLREKEMKLTDIRLDALTSAHQLEQLRDAMNKMKNEMSSLKADNERLHRLVGDKGSGTNGGSTLSPVTSSSSHTSGPVFYASCSNSLATLPSPSSAEKIPTALISSLSSKPNSLDFLNRDSLQMSDGKRVTVSVASQCDADAAGTYIGSVTVSGKTKWDVLDSQVKKIFKLYLSRIDPATNLGLTTESIQAFSVGEVVRTKDCALPELLPYGYLVGSATNIQVHLKGPAQSSVDGLAFETAIPKTIVQRYVSLLLEHRRIVLCGPSGTGKTYLAHKLAEHLVARSGRDMVGGGSTIATFSVDNKSCLELKQYLSCLREQCENAAAELTAMADDDLPGALIIDNLHACGSNGTSLASAFTGFLSHKHPKCPYIICTMSQGASSSGNGSSTTSLQLHHNFRWVLCANHMEPVKGLLGRCLRRRLVEVEVRHGVHNNDLCKVIDWLPKVWLHINKCLETHNSVDATLGPQLLMACPMELSTSQLWFTDLWNYSVVPYLLDVIRSGLQTYGHRATWEDPAEWLLQTYPWPDSSEETDKSLLLHIRAEDMGFDKDGMSLTNEQSSNAGKVMVNRPSTDAPEQQLAY